VFKRDRKTAMDGAEVMCSGRLFQTRAASQRRPPTTDSRVKKICSVAGLTNKFDACRVEMESHLYE